MAGPTMKFDRFPPRIRSLEPFSERFEAFRLAARDCDVLFASYPAGTRIDAHAHDTENWGVITRGEMMLTVAGRETRYGPGDWYHIAPRTPHAARCAVDTEEIEFWFTPEGRRKDVMTITTRETARWPAIIPARLAGLLQRSMLRWRFADKRVAIVKAAPRINADESTGERRPETLPWWTAHHPALSFHGRRTDPPGNG